MVKVFLSSTARDLGAYRQRAIEICQRFDFQPLAMEYFEAMGVGATEGSRRKVDQAELYVGIYAYRYGYIEPGQTKGVTELEFERAKERGLDRLCFLVDPSYPWPPEAIDYDNRDKLEDFKRRIEKFHIRALFTTLDDFSLKLAQALIAWKHERGMTTSDDERPVARRIVLAPPRPNLLIGRDNDLEALRVRLKNAAQREQVTVVRGWPGVGKTTLISSLAYDEALEQDFPDGVLWATVGQKPDPYVELRNWAKMLDLPDVGVTLSETIQAVKRELVNRRMLLIADDVWAVADAMPYREVIGRYCALLLTTRANEIAAELADTPNDIYRLNQLTDEQALELLRRLAPNVMQLYPNEAIILVQELEGLPLAVRVVGRLLDNEARIRGDVAGLIERLRQGTELLKGKSPADRAGMTMSQILSQSTDRLEPPMRYRFAMLGTFAPKPATFDLDAMSAIWEDTTPLSSVRVLTDLGLLEPLPSIGRFQMHALLVMHAKELLNDEEKLTRPAVIFNAPARQAQVSLPVVDVAKDSAYVDLYLKPEYQRLKLLRRRAKKGEEVSVEIDAVIARILQLGGTVDDA